MYQGDPPVHTLIITPKAQIGIFTLRIGDCHNKRKNGESTQYEKSTWAILIEYDCKRKPCARDQLNNDAKGKSFCGLQWHICRRHNDENDKRSRKDAAYNEPVEYLFDSYPHTTYNHIPYLASFNG